MVFFINLLIYIVNQWLILDCVAICTIPKRTNGSDLDKGDHKVQKLTSIVHFVFANISRLVNDQRWIFDMVAVLKSF